MIPFSPQWKAEKRTYITIMLDREVQDTEVLLTALETVKNVLSAMTGINMELKTGTMLVPVPVQDLNVAHSISTIDPNYRPPVPSAPGR
jgi:hypothetical protein